MLSSRNLESGDIILISGGPLTRKSSSHVSVAEIPTLTDGDLLVVKPALMHKECLRI